MDKLNRLIEILLTERGGAPPPVFTDDRSDLFRALCNVRPPMPVTEEFLCLQDAYLSEVREARGVVDANALPYEHGVALWQGDITRLKCDAIVNACNSALLGCFAPLHACIDNCIHSFGGVQIRLDCAKLMQGGSEPNGRCRVTGAYNLPSRFVFHTVGPIVSGRVTPAHIRDLRACYRSCLEEAEHRELSTLAFCCISTGVFGYPKAAACAIAVDEVLQHAAVGRSLRVIFNVFSDGDRAIYEKELARRV